MDKPLPTLEEVIIKVKQMQNLTPEEEFVYLIYIEEVPADLARKMIEEKVNGFLNDEANF